jgi:signal transduction histidine kinase
MRGLFSEKFRKNTEESAILKKVVIKILSLGVCGSIIYAIIVNVIVSEGLVSLDYKKLTLQNYIFMALIPCVVGSSFALIIFYTIIFHIKKIFNYLSCDLPDWKNLENEYMESDVKNVYLAIKKLHVKLSDQKAIEKAHAETRRVLATMNDRMDEERRRISRQLHDEINPKLVLSKLELQKLDSIIVRKNLNLIDVESARTITDKVTDFINQIYKESREIIKNTRVEIIDSIGLTSAIESMVGNYKSALGDNQVIHLEHNLPRHPKFNSTVALNTYRIIQEAVLNATKHAHATLIIISAAYKEDDDNITALDVSIEDNGIGIHKTNELGVGLIDMRERARTLNCELHIEENKAGGTKISFSFTS